MLPQWKCICLNFVWIPGVGRRVHQNSNKDQWQMFSLTTWKRFRRAEIVPYCEPMQLTLTRIGGIIPASEISKPVANPYPAKV